METNLDRKNQVNCGGTGVFENGSLGFDDLVQLIMQNDYVYSYLIYYFIDWISDQAFEDDAKEQVKNGKSLRQVHAEHFASWIPCEDCADKIYDQIQDLSR